MGCKGWVFGGLCAGHSSSLELARQAEALVLQTWQGGAPGRSTDRISLEQGASSYTALWPGARSFTRDGGWGLAGVSHHSTGGSSVHSLGPSFSRGRQREEGTDHCSAGDSHGLWGWKGLHPFHAEILAALSPGKFMAKGLSGPICGY